MYDRSVLSLDAHLEGELGIDSVLLATILSALCEEIGVSKTQIAMRPATVRELIDLVERQGPSVQRSEIRADGFDEVIEAIVRHTRYPRSDVGVDTDLEGELGIDSVVLASVLADLKRENNLADGSFRGGSLRTVRDIADRLASLVPPKPAPSLRPAASVGPSPPARTAPTLEGVMARFLGAVPERADLPFTAQGASEDAVRGLYGALQQELSLPESIRLLDCATPEALARYVQATRDHAARRAPQPWDPRTMKDFVELRDRDLFAKVRSFKSFYARRRSDRLYWYGMPLESPCRNRAVIFDEVAGKKREFLMFASNNYLGLANHSHVTEAVARAVKKYGATNTGCRLIGGTNVLHKELEQRLARFKGREACIVYPSGYSANLGCISALVKTNDAVIMDKLCHMSIADGCKLSGAARKIFQHNDVADLERVLSRTSGQADGMLVVTEGVFSMHGDVARLPEIAAVAKRYNARVLVDEAHATGVLGERGSGTSEHFGMKGGVDLELGTMSKTLAGLGGFVVGDEDVIEYLRFYSNSYVFAANIPAAVAAGLIASIDVIESEPERIAQLWNNIRHLKTALSAQGFDLGDSDSAIIPVVLGDDRQALEMGRAVRERGMFCQTVVYPGVSVGDARLRISVSSEHTKEDLDLAAAILRDAAEETGVKC
jgi:glycine C-acetyltransferase